jgi:hypothetical protein
VTVERNGHESRYEAIYVVTDNVFMLLNVEFKDGHLMKLVYFRRLMLLPQTVRSEFNQVLSSRISIVCKTFNKYNFKIFPSFIFVRVM